MKTIAHAHQPVISNPMRRRADGAFREALA